MKITLNRVNKAVHFRGINEEGNTIDIDGSPSIGGQYKGVRPMQLLLMSIASCSSMDIVSILKKMQQNLNDLTVEVNATRDEKSTPSVFAEIHLNYVLTGDIDEKKAKKAIALSVEKYCSVAAMLEKTARISHSFQIRP